CRPVDEHEPRDLRRVEVLVVADVEPADRPPTEDIGRRKAGALEEGVELAHDLAGRRPDRGGPAPALSETGAIVRAHPRRPLQPRTHPVPGAARSGEAAVEDDRG